jgi:cytochrome c
MKPLHLSLLVAAVATMPSLAAAAPLPKPATFAVCAACHQVSPTGRAVIGPNLWAVGGRKAGTAAGFAYSPAMKAAGYKWDRAKLVAFISNPQGAVPGTRMAFGGIKDPAKATELANYLLSLK